MLHWAEPSTTLSLVVVLLVLITACVLNIFMNIYRDFSNVNGGFIIKCLELSYKIYQGLLNEIYQKSIILIEMEEAHNVTTIRFPQMKRLHYFSLSKSLISFAGGAAGCTSTVQNILARSSVFSQIEWSVIICSICGGFSIIVD